MEFNNTQKNSSGAAQPQQVAPRLPVNGGGVSGMRGNNNKMIVIAAVVVVVLILAGLGLWMWKGMGGAGASVKSGQYQALFLTNGQVYFGKLADVDDKYVKLTDIYYLQVQQGDTVQPADNKTSNQQPQVSLAKLGSELHGPEDQMEVNRDQVLFFENLKDDSKVVQAIKQNQNK